MTMLTIDTHTFVNRPFGHAPRLSLSAGIRHFARVQ